MLDMSIATVAGGKVYAARERGEPIPATWLIGEDGLPTDDPASYPEHSVLTPAAVPRVPGVTGRPAVPRRGRSRPAMFHRAGSSRLYVPSCRPGAGCRAALLRRCPGRRRYSGGWK